MSQIIFIDDAGAGGDPYFANVTLLMHGDGTAGATATVDSSSYGRTINSAGSPLPTLSSTQAKFGGTSMAFTGSGNSAFTAAASADTQFGTGDFTVEFWLYNTSLSTAPYFLSNRRTSTGLGWYLNCSSGGTAIWGWDGGTLSIGTGITTGMWQHIAISRVSGVIYFFIDGVLKNAGGTAHTINYALVDRVFAVGRDNSSGNNVNGWIDDLRITKGVGRYTATFTPPTAAFPNS